MWIINPREDYHFDPSGRIHSDPSLTYGTSPNPAGWSGIIPSAWFLQKNDDVHLLFRNFGTMHVVGGNADVASDGMTASSPAMRAQILAPHGSPALARRISTGVWP